MKKKNSKYSSYNIDFNTNYNSDLYNPYTNLFVTGGNINKFASDYNSNNFNLDNGAYKNSNDPTANINSKSTIDGGAIASNALTGLQGGAELLNAAKTQVDQVKAQGKIYNQTVNNSLDSSKQIGGNSTDDLMNQLSGLTTLNTNIGYRDLLSSKSDAAMNIMGSSMSGAGTGASVGGGYGAAIGGGVGILTGLFGRMAAKRKAKKLAREYNEDAKNAMDYQLRAVDNAVENQRDYAMLNSNIQALGGPINMKYSGTNSPFGNRFNEGEININEDNKGKFTALADTYGMTPLQIANHIFANKNDYNSMQIKRANFVRNSANWHANGGPIFNPFTKTWTVNGKPLRQKINKSWGYTIYTNDGFAVNYNKNNHEIGRKKGTQTPSIIGKTRGEQQQKYFDKDKRYSDSVKVISKRYELNPNLVASRLGREAIDLAIEKYNITGGNYRISKSKMRPNHYYKEGDGRVWGLDDFTTHMQTGQTKLLEPWVKPYSVDFINEQNRLAHSAAFNGWSDIISGTAAELKGRRDRIKKVFPHLNNAQLDAAASASFNLGEEGAINRIKKQGINSISKWNPYINLKANGGNLDNQFSDFRNGIIEYNVGGTHEENPNEGIQVGVDPQGTPNLVEEGEVNYNDYIFSNRLKVPKDFRKQYGLGTSKKQMSYAEAAKKLQKESEERPLDNISKRGLDAALNNLANSQEETKFKQQMKNPQFRQQAMQAIAQQQAEQQSVQQPSEEEMMAMQQAAQQEQPFAYGGNLYENGSWLKGNNLATKASFGQLYSNENTDVNKPIGWDIEWQNFMNKLNGRPSVEELSNNSEMWDFSDFPEENEFKSSDYSKIPYSTEISDNPGFYRSKSIKDLYDNYLLNNPKAFTEWTSHLGGITEDYAREHFKDIRNGLQGYGSWTPNLRRKIDFDENPSPLQRNVDIMNSSNSNENKAPNENNNYGELEGLPTWMRYAPAFTGIAGLFSKPNYSAANMLQSAINRTAQYNPIKGSYIGDYLKYNPYDINYTANQIRQQGNAQQSTIRNASAGNRATALANMMAANYNTQLALGNAYRQAQEYNDNLRAKVGEFNRGTNQFNAQIANQVAQFNAQQRAAANAQYLNGMTQVAQMREKQQLLADQAKSNAISSIGTSLGNIGRENFAANQQLGLLASKYYGAIDPAIMKLILKNNGINPRSNAFKTYMEHYTKNFEKQNELDKKVEQAKEDARKKINNKNKSK